MAAKQRELTPDEIKQINKQAALMLAIFIAKRVLMAPLLFVAFIVLTMLGVTTSQVIHTLTGEHNIRQD